MVMAAARSIRDSGNANFANTVLCGFDGNQVALEAVQDGSLALDVAQEGYQMGYKAMEAAIAALSGETVDSFIDSGVTVVSSDNVADYIDTMKSIGVWSE
jgi:ribose transport system substrate-binding protein